MKIILLTGCAGFIGFHTTKKLCDKNIFVIGVDNLDSYYDVELKKERIKFLKKYYKNKFKFLNLDINDLKILNKIKNNKIDYIIHLAAQAGVRHSIKNPDKYFDNNIKGFYNMLKAAVDKKVKHFIYASSSSVYGNNDSYPSKEINNTDKPLSFYAASKKCNEVMAYSFSNIYKIPTTGLRFFTVFGPYGRPDMALFKFTKKIINNKSIDLFNNGNHVRDFTYIDDIVNGIYKILTKIPKTDIPYEIINIGSGKPRTLNYFLKIIEKVLNKKSKKKYLEYQKGDVLKTSADISKLKKKINFKTNINFEDGIKNFIKWYKKFYS
ncbi:NAD-dependent epimerase/dehydratase family protein [Candidatus Pelagibacter ubique]|nr:NAD-dependent epimerase/dehydratase family protein [Candidatus Pelagibacter ubique]